MRPHRPRRSRARPRRCGAAAVEFALVAPVFFLFVFGMIEFGRSVMVAQLTLHATRSATREAVVSSDSRDDVSRKVEDELARLSVPREAVQVARIAYEDPKTQTWQEVESLGGVPTRSRVRITVRVDYRKASWLPRSMLAGDGWITASVTMTKER